MAINGKPDTMAGRNRLWAIPRQSGRPGRAVRDMNKNADKAHGAYLAAKARLHTFQPHLRARYYRGQKA